MNLYYNAEGIGDTLIISLKSSEVPDLQFEKKNEVVRIYDHKTNETLGYNIFHIKNRVNIEGKGAIPFNEDTISQVNQLIEAEGFTSIQYVNEPDFVVGYVNKKEKHPNADKLSICQVDVGTTQLQIVCGAPNVDEGQKVVVARVGAIMPSGTVIKEASLRGVSSSGMICSPRELDLPNAPQEKGILVLENQYNVGDDFFAKSK